MIGFWRLEGDIGRGECEALCGGCGGWDVGVVWSLDVGDGGGWEMTYGG